MGFGFAVGVCVGAENWDVEMSMLQVRMRIDVKRRMVVRYNIRRTPAKERPRVCRCGC